MSTEWLAEIAAQLNDSLGTQDQKARAYQAALDLDKLLPCGTPNADRFSGLLRRMFAAWIHRMHYLAGETALDHHLPETVHRSDIEVATQYGCTSERAIAAAQKRISDAEDARIARCVRHLNAGWEPEMAVCFCGSKSEWRAALHQVGRMAA